VGLLPGNIIYWRLRGYISCFTRKEVSVTWFLAKVRDVGEGVGKL
jgi:hypothetical protein